MAIAVLSSRNTANVLPEIAITGRVVLQPHTWYTCPTGKKAIIKGYVVCTGRGSASTVDLDLAGITEIRWTGATFSNDIDYDGVQRLNVSQLGNSHVKMTFAIQLAAGETVETNQNSGTNAEINMNANALELPA